MLRSTLCIPGVQRVSVKVHTVYTRREPVSVKVHTVYTRSERVSVKVHTVYQE